MKKLDRSARAAAPPPLIWVLLLTLVGGCGGEDPERGDDSVTPIHYEQTLTVALVHENVRLDGETILDVDWYEAPDETWGESCLSADVFVKILLTEHTAEHGCTTVRSINLDESNSFSFQKPTDVGAVTIHVRVADDASSLFVDIPLIADDLELPRTEEGE